jgi:hypothetical protein
VESADASGVAGTPTFFVNGRRHYGAYDLDSLTAAVRNAQEAMVDKAQGPLSADGPAGRPPANVDRHA